MLVGFLLFLLVRTQGLTSREQRASGSTSAIRDSRSVYVVDSHSGTLLKDIAMSLTPFGVAVNPNTDRVYVSALGASIISIIDGSTNTQTAAVGVPEFPDGILAPLILALCVTPLVRKKISRKLRVDGHDVG